MRASSPATGSPNTRLASAGFVTEAVLTAFFPIVIMGATHRRAAAGLAPIANGLAVVLIHLISIPVTNTSVNPVRSTRPALVEGGIARQQLWVFWLAPLVAGVGGGWAYRELIAGND